MIITRSPLRISLGGGGTDLPSYYRDHGGFLIAAAIDKYIYITVHRRFVDGFLLKYSHLEEVASIDEIKHPIIREALKLAGVQERNLEIASMADIPAGTGLGSSGGFTTALLKALHALRKNLVHPSELGRAGMSHRDGKTARTNRQTGPIHRRVRRHHLFSVPAGWSRPGLAAQYI